MRSFSRFKLDSPDWGYEIATDFVIYIQSHVTGEESWVHHYQSESKCVSMQWKHPNSPSTKKFKVTSTPSAGKVLLTVFWNSQGVLLVRFQSV
jgi:hypothetical protein